jgi:dipeptidyl aminopeptidase/acylaminoacyl peptidase
MRTSAARIVVIATLLLAATRAQADTPTPSPPPDRTATERTTDEIEPAPLPDVRWFTLETPHFRVHFYENERAIAQRTAIVAERGFRLLTRYLNWMPSGRINLTLNDQTDFADGFASSVPYNFIYGFGAVPGALDELNDFDDYLKLLITHELTHVVHLDTIMGFARIYNALLGKLYAPNLSQPNWFVEGLAVLQESRQTTAGRLRSAIFDMELRAPFLEGHVLGLDSISNGPLIFPQGTAAYLYGSSVLKYLEDRYGPLKIQEISHRYGRSLIPGAINRITGRAVGLPYSGVWSPGIWEDWKRSTSHKYALQAEEARRRGLSESRRLTYEAPGPRGDGLAPRYFPDGSLLYHRQNTDQAPAFMRLDTGSGKAELLSEIYGAGVAVPTPDGRSVIFHRLNFVPVRWRVSGASHLAWNDLYSLDLTTGERRELTRGRRANEPDVSPDGKQIVCTLGGPGTRQLALVPIEGGVPRVIAGDVPGLVYSPTWSPDGKVIAYSRWKDGGYRDIHLYDLATGTDRALARDRAMDVDPRFSPDGRYLLYSSDRTGIYNVFAYDLAAGRHYQVTNVLGGAFQSAVSPDGKELVFMGFTSAGYDLFSVPYDPWTWLPAQPFANTRPENPPELASLADSPDAEPGEPPVKDVVQRIEPYRPWKFMYPHSWLIEAQSDPLGVGNAARVQFTLNDPANNHVVTFDSLIPGDGDASVRLDYAYQRLWPSLALTLTRSAVLASDLIIDGAPVSYRQHAASGSASVGLPVLVEPEAQGNLAFGYTYSAYGPADPLPVADPTHGITIKPQTGPDANLFLTWNFSNALAWPYSISYQEGRRLQLVLQIADPALGSRFSTTELTWAWTEYLTPPWARLHALALLYSGGVGIGDKRAFFPLGGFVDQDLVRTLFLNRRQCCTFLRGYAPGTAVGDQFHLFSAEYRLPLLWFERGYATFPVYLRRLTGAAFADAGNAFFGSFHPSDLRYGVGGELRFSLTLAYYIESEIQFGYARGLSTGGSDQIYVVTSFPF